VRSQTTRLGRRARAAIVVAAVACHGCSLSSMAVNAVLPTLVNPAVYLSEEDPELARAALPFLLKTIESIIEADPEHRDALAFANSGFVLYASAFLQHDAALAEWEDYELARDLNNRALRMYLRARDFGSRAVELKHPGMSARLVTEPSTAVTAFEIDDVEALYYLGGAWMLGISLGLDQPALVADLPSARALLDRAIELDEDYNRGSLHTAFITLESVGDALGGSYVKAREHFERAVELSEGLDAGPYVAMALGVSVAEENRQEFIELLEAAVAIDIEEEPSNRLLNTLSQQQARMLLSHVDDLFFAPLDEFDQDESGVDEEIQ